MVMSSSTLTPCISKTKDVQTMVSEKTLPSIKLQFQHYIVNICQKKNKKVPLKNDDVIVDFDPCISETGHFKSIVS